MPSWALELFVIVLLALLNGFFAAAEIAILTARRGRLEQWAEDGDGASRVAINLAKDADRFLPTVQVGITLVGTFASAFAGARLQDPLERFLRTMPVEWIAVRSSGISITAVVLGVDFAIDRGELVPKRIAFQNAEPLARFVAYPMLLLQRASQPAIWFLQFTTRSVLRVLGQRTDQPRSVSVEDIQHLIDAGTEAGLLEESEQKVASEALRLGDRTVSEILRPRIDIDALDVDTPSSEVIGALAMSGFSRIPFAKDHRSHCRLRLFEGRFPAAIFGSAHRFAAHDSRAPVHSQIDHHHSAAGTVPRAQNATRHRAGRVWRHARHGDAGRRAGNAGG